MSLLIGDDYPEAVEPHGRENPVPAQGLRDGRRPEGSGATGPAGRAAGRGAC